MSKRGEWLGCSGMLLLQVLWLVFSRCYLGSAWLMALADAAVMWFISLAVIGFGLGLWKIGRDEKWW